jgi:hypothetical protein
MSEHVKPIVLTNIEYGPVVHLCTGEILWVDEGDGELLFVASGERLHLKKVKVDVGSNLERVETTEG